MKKLFLWVAFLVTLILSFSGCAYFKEVPPGTITAMREAVVASDPRVVKVLEYPLTQIRYDGFSRTANLEVVVSGDQEISSELIRKILKAAAENAGVELNTISLSFYPEDDSKPEFSLESALKDFSEEEYYSGLRVTFNDYLW